MKKFSKNANLLMICTLADSITSMFIYTFLLAYILNVSSNGIVNVALFYLVLHSSMIALSWVAAPLFKRLNKSTILKIGILFKFAFVLFVVAIGNKVVNYVYLIAICDGLAEVLFWGGVTPLQAVVTEKQQLPLYLSVITIIKQIMGLVLGVLMGLLIDKTGMYIISIVMLVVVSLQLILAIFITHPDEKDNQKLQYKEFWELSKIKYPQTRATYFNIFLSGFISNFSMIILYFTVITFGTNISLGIFSAISTLLSMVILIFYNVKKTFWVRYPVSISASIIFSASVLFMIFSLGKISLSTFNVIWAIATVVPTTITSVLRLNITKTQSLEKYNIENVTISETYLDFGRVVGEALLLTMGLVNNYYFDIVCLCLCSVGVVYYFLNTTAVCKKIPV
ncbi:MAG: hypothetical protein IJ542_00660 [Clostridia bacterium]|nr:hypothetical protein [Clostridia bacterium]